MVAMDVHMHTHSPHIFASVCNPCFHHFFARPMQNTIIANVGKEVTAEEFSEQCHDPRFHFIDTSDFSEQSFINDLLSIHFGKYSQRNKDKYSDVFTKYHASIDFTHMLRERIDNALESISSDDSSSQMFFINKPQSHFVKLSGTFMEVSVDENPDKDLTSLLQDTCAESDLIDQMSSQCDEIVDEPIAESLNQESAVKEIMDELTENLDEKPTVKLVKSSYYRGVIGENGIQQIIHSVRPEFDIIDTHRQPHSADIHVVDPATKLRYIVEVKNKLTIKKQDIEKFVDDVSRARAKYLDEAVVGLFVSISANSICKKGSKITIERNNMIYLPKSFVTEDILETIFTLMPSYVNIIDKSLAGDVPEYVRGERYNSLLCKLRAEYTSLEEEKEMCKRMHSRAMEEMSDASKHHGRILLKQSIIELLNEEVRSFAPKIVKTNMGATREQQFREFILSITRRTNMPSKKDLMSMFPDMFEYINARTVEAIWREIHGAMPQAKII